MTNNSVDSNKKLFLSMVFLESICDKDRDTIAQSTNKNLSEFKSIIKDENYSSISNMLCEISNANTFIIFQTFDGRPISNKTAYNDIVVIEKSTCNSKHNMIEITRSELLDFYRCTQTTNDNSCRELLDIKNSLKIVSVDDIQNDTIVKEYLREKCSIAYLQLQFNADKERPQNVYIALLYEENQKYFDVLSNTKNVLAFRNEIVKRFKSDFKENKPAQYADTKFREEWLADKKAGDHMCDYNIDAICKKFFDSANGMIGYFHNESKDVLSDKDSMILIANTHIARYFRRLVSDRFCTIGARSTEISENENILKQIVDFSQESELFDVDRRLNNDRYNLIISKGSNYALPISKKSKNIKTYKIKYLQCFLIDILNSMTVHTKKEECPSNYLPQIMVEEDRENLYCLSFKNIMYKANDNEKTLELIKLEKNYELKQRIEFEKNASGNAAQGISLGSLAKFINDFDGIDSEINIEAYYEIIEIDGNNYWQFVLKLPILTMEED